MKRIKAVLFDWNGTIMDDLDVGFNACNHMLRYYGVPTISKERFKKTFDTPWLIFYERNGVTRERINLTKHQKEFMKVYNSLSEKAKPRENIRKVFEWLKNNRILIGIVSYHIKEDIEKNLKKHGLSEFLNVIIGEETNEEAGTSENKKIKSALSRLGILKNEAAYVGDTSHDIFLSKKEGLLTVGITNGWQSKDILTKAEPDYLIENMEEVIDIVKKINGRDRMIIDGKKIAEEIKRDLKKRVEKLKRRGIEPTLAIILVGEKSDSNIYIRNKQKACEEIGIISKLYKFPENVKQEELINSIEDLNEDDSVHGIMVEMSLPNHLNQKSILRAISPVKDVDGLNPITIGNLSIGNEFLVPATPKGIIRLLEKMKIPVEGKEIVIINNSNVVGKPLALMLTNRFGTVTICHVKTKDLKTHTINADILITAVGSPNLIKKDMVKKDAVVIDAGIKLIDDKIMGDVDFKNVKDVASYITPVPGGVGPITVAMILENTLIATENAII